MEETFILSQAFITALIAMGTGAPVADADVAFVARRLCEPPYRGEILGRKNYDLRVGPWVVTCENGRAIAHARRSGVPKR